MLMEACTSTSLLLTEVHDVVSANGALRGASDDGGFAQRQSGLILVGVVVEQAV